MDRKIDRKAGETLGPTTEGPTVAKQRETVTLNSSIPPALPSPLPISIVLTREIANWTAIWTLDHRIIPTRIEIIFESRDVNGNNSPHSLDYRFPVAD